MIKHKYPGLFIAFEGLDGSGSSTQVDLLKKNLVKMNYRTFTTKEPTDNNIGGLIRGVLTHQWRMPSDGLQLLYAADRAHHIERLVLPTVEKGDIIITDRYAFSSMAFGSIDVDLNWLKTIYRNYPLPDITFLIKVWPEVCIERIGKTRSHFELFEQKQKLEKVWRTYNSLAKIRKNNIVVIDGERKITEIKKEILEHVKPILKAKKIQKNPDQVLAG